MKQWKSADVSESNQMIYYLKSMECHQQQNSNCPILLLNVQLWYLNMQLWYSNMQLWYSNMQLFNLNMKSGMECWYSYLTWNLYSGYSKPIFIMQPWLSYLKVTLQLWCSILNCTLKSQYAIRHSECPVTLFYYGRHSWKIIPLPWPVVRQCLNIKWILFLQPVIKS